MEVCRRVSAKVSDLEKNVTMRDIALRAAVSRPTVSAVLNRRGDLGRISADTQQRVWQTAREMGYRRNEMARAIVSGKTRMLGFLGGFPDYEHVGQMLGGALEEVEKSGYSMKVFGCLQGDAGRASIERCVELRLSGVIALRMDPNILDYLQEEMSHYHIPIVFLDMSRALHAQLGAHVGVYSDDAHGIAAGVEHLVALGHRQIAFLGGTLPADEAAAKRSRNGTFEAVMESLHLPLGAGFSTYAGSYWNADDAERAACELLNRKPRPTAILCGNDAIAMTVLRTARQMGLQLPAQLSVMGFGDFTMARFADPPLTTIAQPFEEMGRVAVRHLLNNKTWDESQLIRSELVPTQVVVRASTGVCPRNGEPTRHSQFNVLQTTT